MDLTYSLTAHLVASQAVSAPLASSPRAFVDPAAHAVHTLDLTYSLTAHLAALIPAAASAVARAAAPLVPHLASITSSSLATLIVHPKPQKP